VGDYIGDITSHAIIQNDRPIVGRRLGIWLKYHSCVVYSFFVTQNFARVPETKPQNRFLRGLIHRMSIPGYCIPKGIKVR